jgi:hypothetical protein
MKSRVSLRIAAGLAVMLLGAAASGCYHVIISTDIAPGTEVHNDTFRPAFIAGLVPAKIDASKYCGGKRWASVETQYSFLDVIVGLVTAGIFTPMDAKITCAAS